MSKEAMDTFDCKVPGKGAGAETREQGHHDVSGRRPGMEWELPVDLQAVADAAGAIVDEANGEK